MKNCDECDNEQENGMAVQYKDSHVMLSKARTIFLAEEVTSNLASQIIAMLLYFDKENPELPIHMYIHSVGGSIHGLFGIYDVMQMIRAPIITICAGECYSAAAIILAAGTKGYRMAMKNSKIMIHGLQCLWPLPGIDVKNSQKYHTFLKQLNENVMETLAQHSGQSLDKVRKDCLEDVWFSPNDAKRYGIIDRII
jgi:ATP-dependent Clp protease protease subunit